MQVNSQHDGYSCGVIVLNAIDRILRFAENCHFNLTTLSEMKGDDIQYNDIIQASATYRQKIAVTLLQLFHHFKVKSSESHGVFGGKT